ncbi:MAG: class I SAM-dependent methyltransferase [Prevotellaceae bacterium]|jgi:SAM-dependent methyltransferase|nr:class I SAM-dependent methyltransferase [Prevotellaceae bacterium]
MQKKLVPQEKWEKGWVNHTGHFIAKPSIDKLLKKYLPVNSDYNFIELGSSPGNNLVYFAKTFHYNVTGLDYAGVDVTRNYLCKHNVISVLVDEDMFEWKSENKYDVVFSTGVVEHFDPIDTVFDIHKNACKQGGYIIICIPNIRYVNKWVADLFNPGLSAEHNLKMMKPEILRGQFDNQYEILYCDYYKTSLLDLEPNYDFLGKRTFLKKVHKFLQQISAALKIDNIPNRFFSPNIVIVARKTTQITL